jgi:hypothetical protein
MELKICSKCRKEKPFELFAKNKSTKDGFDAWCKECKHQQYIENKKERANYQRIYMREHPEIHKKYELKNTERLKEYRKDYFIKNKEKILNYNRKYIKNRRKEDDLFKFKQNVRILINQSFKRGKFKKKNHTMDILGCNFEELKMHLHKTFFMNYGYEYDGKEDVHIDHIIPLATAKTQEDVKRLCHYTNLQLLKASDNLKKSAKM